MQTVNMYSSEPTGTGISLALLGLEAQGLVVQMRPLSELQSPSTPPPGLRLVALQTELQDICLALACLGERLTEHEERRWVLDAGTEQGLLFDRQALLARKRAVEAQLRQEGARHD